MSLGNLECRLRPHPGMALTGASDRLLRPDPEASLPADAAGLPRSPCPRASATRINSLITSPLNWPLRPLGVTSTHRDRDTHRRTHIDRPRHMWKDMPVCTRTHTHRHTHTHSLQAPGTWSRRIPGEASLHMPCTFHLKCGPKRHLETSLGTS